MDFINVLGQQLMDLITSDYLATHPQCYLIDGKRIVFGNRHCIIQDVFFMTPMEDIVKLKLTILEDKKISQIKLDMDEPKGL